MSESPLDTLCQSDVVSEPPLDAPVMNPIYSWAQQISEEGIVASCREFIEAGFQEMEAIHFRIEEIKSSKNLNEGSADLISYNKNILHEKRKDVKKSMKTLEYFKKCDDRISNSMLKFENELETFFRIFKDAKYFKRTIGAEVNYLSETLRAKVNSYIIHESDFDVIKSVVDAYLVQLKSVRIRACDRAMRYGDDHGRYAYQCLLDNAKAVCLVSPFHIRTRPLKC